MSFSIGILTWAVKEEVWHIINIYNIHNYTAEFTFTVVYDSFNLQWCSMTGRKTQTLCKHSHPLDILDYSDQAWLYQEISLQAVNNHSVFFRFQPCKLYTSLPTVPCSLYTGSYVKQGFFHVWKAAHVLRVHVIAEWHITISLWKCSSACMVRITVAIMWAHVVMPQL